MEGFKCTVEDTNPKDRRANGPVPAGYAGLIGIIRIVSGITSKTGKFALQDQPLLTNFP